MKNKIRLIQISKVAKYGNDSVMSNSIHRIVNKSLKEFFNTNSNNRKIHHLGKIIKQRGLVLNE